MIKKLIDVANKEIGYKVEEENKYVLELGKIKKFYNKDINECDSSLVFVDWCLANACGIDKVKDLVCQSNKELSSNCLFSEKHYKNNAEFYSIPITGDQVFFKNETKEICGTGIVTKVDEKNIYTVELKDNVVVAAMYEKNYGGISGYGRPRYETLSEKIVEETIEDNKNDNEENKDIDLAPITHAREEEKKEGIDLYEVSNQNI